MGVQRDQGAFDVGQLTQAVGSLGNRLALSVGGHRIDGDDVAGGEHVGRVCYLGAALLALFPRFCPFHFGQRNAPRGAVSKADHGAFDVEADDDCQPMLSQPLDRGGVEQFAPPVAGNIEPRALGQPRDRPAPAVAAVVSLESFSKQPVGDRLEGGIDGGAHRQPALVQLLLAELPYQLAAHLLGEVFGGHVFGGRAPADPEFRLFGLRCLRLVDVAFGQQPPDHPIAPGLGGLRLFDRVVVVGRLRQGGQERRLGDGQVVHRFVEVIERRRGDAIRPEAEVDLVHIELQDAILGKGAFDAEGQDRLLDLSAPRQLVGEQEVLCHLLGDGRGADRALRGADILDVDKRRAEDAQHIDARVDVEVLVLGGQERLHHAPWHRLDRHEDPFLDRVFGQQPAVAGVNPGHDRRLIIGELLVFGKVAAVIVENEQHPASAGQREDEQNSQ